MLRHFYRCALRLHPPGFRKRFGAEMLSIFEQAPSRSTAFWLLFDGIVSLARQWTMRPTFWREISASSSPLAASDGVPSFSTVDPFRPRPSAVINGMVLSITLFCVTCFAIRYSWIHVLHVQIPEVQYERSEWVPPSSSMSDPDELSVPQAVEMKTPAALRSAPTSPPANQTPAITTADPRQIAQPPLKRDPASDARSPVPLMPTKGIATRLSPTAVATDTLLNPAIRQRVIAGAIAELTQYYVYPDTAAKIADSLRAHEQSGDNNATIHGEDFAALLTSQMRDVSHDQHLRLVYNVVAIPGHSLAPTPEAIARYRKEMQRTNCTFEKVAMLPHNVGYVKFNSFPDPSLCQSTAAAAMASVNGADAIIFDLRDNHGGSPSMVALMASYLFEHPTHLDDLYNRSEDSTLQSWTLSPVDGNKLADKPAYVLTSASTFSGAEEFSYDLKMLHRATIVGETTAGGAHMVRSRRIDEHFSIGVPDTRPINPISKTDWEGTGIEPDVKVNADDALQTAETLAQGALARQ